MQRSLLFAVLAAGMTASAAPSIAHAADKPGFVSTTTLQETGGYALEVGLSKPVTIRSAKSARLKPGQACNIHLESVRQAFRTLVKKGTVVLPKANEKPKETHIFLKASINDQGGFECGGQGDTCMIVVTIPPDSQIVD